MAFGDRRADGGAQGQADQEQEEGTLQVRSDPGGLGFVGRTVTACMDRKKTEVNVGLIGKGKRSLIGTPPA
ncbi:hypothetical protein PDR5_23430 [Pseudomonas sp. DR 5-09]|nr:hypothetical protein PDR5_23430 [Pseudomonas sp. DR 5-09]